MLNKNKGIFTLVLITLTSLTSLTYASDKGLIGDLFDFISSGNENGNSITNEWRIDGKYIRDETISSYEIKDGEVKNSDLGDNSVDNRVLKNNEEYTISGATITEDLIVDGKIGIGGDLDGRLTVKGAPDIDEANKAGQGGIVIEDDSGDNTARKMRIDSNEIQTSKDDANSPLYINQFGGNLILGSSGYAGNQKIEINGNGGEMLRLKDQNNDYTDDAYTSYIRGIDKDNDNVWLLGEGSSKKWITFGAYQSDYSLSLLTDNKKRLVVASGGDIGIGTASPTAQLHLKGAGRIRLDGVDNDDYWDLNSYNDGTAFEITQDGNQKLYIHSGGNVGIGTNNPSEKLHINGDLYVQGQDIVFSNGGTTNIDSISYDDGSHLGSAGIYSFHADSTKRPDWDNPTAGISAKGGFFSGSVGIGTSSPGVQFDLRGKQRIIQGEKRDLRIEGLDKNGTDRNLAILGSRDDDKLYLNRANEYASGTFIKSMLDISGDTHISGNVYHKNSSPTKYYEDTNNSNFIQHVNSDRMYWMFDRNDNNKWDDGDDDRIVFSGTGSDHSLKLGIGINSPSYKLHVMGRAKIDGSNAGIRYENGSKDWFVGREDSDDGSDFRWRNNGANRMSISTGGLLTVRGNGGEMLKLKDINSAYTDNAYTSYIRGVDKNDDPVWYVGEGSSNKRVSLMAYKDDYRMSLGTNGRPRLIIGSGGNVGIGNFVPKIDLAIGDSDTGFQQKGDGELAIYTNDKERVRITDIGKVGIGTTTPEEKLTLSGGILKINNSGKYTSIGTISEDYSKFYTDAPKGFYMGTGLTISGALIVNGTLVFSGGVQAAKGIPSSNTSNVGYAFKGDGDTGLFASGGSEASGSNLVFEIDGDNKMTIGSGGNVGIGTDNPEERLTVNGRMKINGQIDSTVGTDGTIMRWHNNGYMKRMTDQGGLFMGTDSSMVLHAGDHLDNYEDDLGITNTGTSENLWLTADNGIRFVTHYQYGYTGAYKSIIDDNGRFGIGTLTPKAQLEVNGGIRAKKGNSDGDSGNIGYSFEGDGDTGLFALGGTATANSNLLLKTDGQARVTILDSNGNVGIGTGSTNPSHKLTIDGRMKINSSNAGIRYENGSKDWFVGRDTSNDGSAFRWWENGKNVMKLSTGGVLSIKGDGMIILDGSGSTDYWDLNAGNNGSHLEFRRNNTQLFNFMTGGILTAESGFGVNGASDHHLRQDGSLYRYGGQAYIGFDDHLYFRDRDGYNRVHIDGDGNTEFYGSVKTTCIGNCF